MYQIAIPGLAIGLSTEPALISSLCCTSTTFLLHLWCKIHTSTATTVIVSAVVTNKMTAIIIPTPIPVFDLLFSLVEGDTFEEIVNERK